MHQVSFPHGPEELTPEWFTAIFRANTLLISEAVIGLQREVIGQDRGFTGVIVRVFLQYTHHEKGAPSSVVVKFPTASRTLPSAYRTAQSQDARAARRYFERCSREVLFYQQIASVGDLPVPQLYYGAIDQTTDHVILVLEDLRLARAGDALHGCTEAEAALVVDRLAQFHARWWMHPLLETHSWLPLWGRDSQTEQSRYRQCLPSFLQQFGSRISRPVLEALDALTTSYGAVRSRLQLAPTTLIHGDLHLDNLLFPPQTEEPGAVIIDWQSVAHGRGVIDLGLFLFGSLEITDRRAAEERLLRRYHELLQTAGVTGYPFSQLMEDCRLVLLWLLGAKVVWLGSLDATRLNGRELALVNASLAEDNFAAFLDHDASSSLPL